MATTKDQIRRFYVGMVIVIGTVTYVIINTPSPITLSIAISFFFGMAVMVSSQFKF